MGMSGDEDREEPFKLWLSPGIASRELKDDLNVTSSFIQADSGF